MNVRNEDKYYHNMELIRERFGDMKLIPVAEAADFLGMSRDTLLSTSSIPVKEVGGGKQRKRRVVPVTGLAAWMC